MANHVSSYIEFENLSDKSADWINSFAFNGFGASENKPDPQTILPTIYENYEESYDFYVDNIGAKWLTFEQVEDGLIHIVTAWSPAYGFYNRLYEYLHKDSPDLVMWVRYDDEMPNFVGCFGRSPYGEYEEYLEGDDAYRDAVGDVPSTEDEQGSWEWNDEWYDKLEEWYDKELVFFQEETKELKEEYIDN